MTMENTLTPELPAIPPLPPATGSAFIRVNYGINRPRPGGRKHDIEHRHGKMRIKGDWEDGETHEKIKAIVWRRHPGWLITGWEIVTPNDQAHESRR